MAKNLPIKDAGYSEELLEILQQWKPAGRNRCLLTQRELLRYCSETPAGAARLLNHQPITPEMVQEVRQKLKKLK